MHAAACMGTAHSSQQRGTLHTLLRQTRSPAQSRLAEPREQPAESPRPSKNLGLVRLEEEGYPVSCRQPATVRLECRPMALDPPGQIVPDGSKSGEKEDRMGRRKKQKSKGKKQGTRGKTGEDQERSRTPPACQKLTGSNWSRYGQREVHRLCLGRHWNHAMEDSIRAGPHRVFRQRQTVQPFPPQPGFVTIPR